MIRQSMKTSDGKVLHGCIDLVGQRFGNLMVISLVNTDGRGHLLWLCKCDCGKEIVCRGASLKNGSRKDCQEKIKPTQDEIRLNTLFSHYKNSSRNRNILFSLTKDEFTNLISMNCFYCGTESFRKSNNKSRYQEIKYNGLDRLDNSRGYEIGNVVPCCETCNYAKKKMSYADFKDWIHRIADHMLSKEMLYASA